MFLTVVRHKNARASRLVDGAPLSRGRIRYSENRGNTACNAKQANRSSQLDLPEESKTTEWKLWHDRAPEVRIWCGVPREKKRRNWGPPRCAWHQTKRNEDHLERKPPGFGPSTKEGMACRAGSAGDGGVRASEAGPGGPRSWAQLVTRSSQLATRNSKRAPLRPHQIGGADTRYCRRAGPHRGLTPDLWSVCRRPLSGPHGGKTRT